MSSLAMECGIKQNPRPFETPQKVGHPESLNQFLGVDVLESYHVFVTKDQAENAKGCSTCRGHEHVFKFESQAQGRNFRCPDYCGRSPNER